MGPIQNAAVILLEIPTGHLQVRKHLKYVKDRTIDLKTVDTQGGIVTKNFVISTDPFILRLMRFAEKSDISKPLKSYFVGKVVKSDNSKYKTGQYVTGMGAFEEYTVFPKAQAESIDVLSEGQLKLRLPLTTWVGAAGMPGQTAYSGFYKVGEPKKGETIFITGASGAVGQIVGQLAKREGLKVIGSAGSDDKVQWLQNELHFDHAFNYKTADIKAELAKYGPINIYFDNVGGDQLEAALDAAAPFARFVECGMISQYIKPDGHGIRNLMSVIVKRIKLQGLFVSDYISDGKFLQEFYSKVPQWIANGELKVKEDITNGLEQAPDAIVGIFEGKNFGKAVVRIADD